MFTLYFSSISTIFLCILEVGTNFWDLLKWLKELKKERIFPDNGPFLAHRSRHRGTTACSFGLAQWQNQARPA
jgi:hypothetical protein